MIEAAILRKLAGPASIAALIAVGLTLYSCAIDQAEKRGGVAQDVKWQAGQDKATTAAKVAKQVTEAASKAASLRAGERHDDELQNLRSAYAALRDELRRQNSRSAAGRADPSRQDAAAGQADAAARAHADQLQAEIDRLRAHLIDVAEEGDGYRLQVMGLQGWIKDDLAATAAGAAAEKAALDDTAVSSPK